MVLVALLGGGNVCTVLQSHQTHGYQVARALPGGGNVMFPAVSVPGALYRAHCCYCVGYLSPMFNLRTYFSVSPPSLLVFCGEELHTPVRSRIAFYALLSACDVPCPQLWTGRYEPFVTLDR